jgi:uncharacterized membrane protein YeaQ/YmgE (transglycosylase-associated protein family)
MTRDVILKQLRKGWLITLVLSPLAAFGTEVLASMVQSGSFELNQSVLLLGITGAVLSVVLVVGASSIFLNLYPDVRDEKTYSLFAWYLAPVVISMVMMTISDATDDWDMWKLYLAMALPFFAIHTWFFTRFVKVLGKAKTTVEGTSEQTSTY